MASTATSTSRVNRTSIHSMTTNVSTIGMSGSLLLFGAVALIASSVGIYAQANTYAYGSDIAWQCNIIAAILGAFSCIVFAIFLMWNIREQNRR